MKTLSPHEDDVLEHAMRHAGREYTEDVKRRIVAACQEAGLTIKSARMYLSDVEDTRIVFVYAFTPEKPPTIEIMTIVPIHGTWSSLIDIKYAAETNPNIWELVNMRGRHEVQLSQLPDELRATVEEREQVLAAMKMGFDGPYRFGEAWWEKVGNPFDFK